MQSVTEVITRNEVVRTALSQLASKRRDRPRERFHSEGVIPEQSPPSLWTIGPAE